MNKTLWIALPVLLVAGTAVGAPPPKSVPAAAIKKFTDFKKTVKPYDPKGKPKVTAVKMPGVSAGTWCGIAVATGKFVCTTSIVMCPTTILLIGGGETPDYQCDVDCHGQIEAGPDGNCDCDIKTDTCKVSN